MNAGNAVEIQLMSDFLPQRTGGPRKRLGVSHANQLGSIRLMAEGLRHTAPRLLSFAPCVHRDVDGIFRARRPAGGGFARRRQTET